MDIVSDEPTFNARPCNAHHGANVQQRRVVPLVLGHTLNASLLDLELPSKPLRPRVHATAILEALARHRAPFVDKCQPLVVREVAHASFGGVLLDVQLVISHCRKPRSRPACDVRQPRARHCWRIGGQRLRASDPSAGAGVPTWAALKGMKRRYAGCIAGCRGRPSCRRAFFRRVHDKPNAVRAAAPRDHSGLRKQSTLARAALQIGGKRDPWVRER